MSEYYFYYNGATRYLTNLTDIFTPLTGSTTASPTNIFAKNSGVYQDLNELFEPIPIEANYYNTFNTGFLSNNIDISQIFSSTVGITGTVLNYGSYLYNQYGTYLPQPVESGILVYENSNDYFLQLGDYYSADNYFNLTIKNTYPPISVPPIDDTSYVSATFYGFFVPPSTDNYTIYLKNIDDVVLLWLGQPNTTNPFDGATGNTTYQDNISVGCVYNYAGSQGSQGFLTASLGSLTANSIYPIVLSYENTVSDGCANVNIQNSSGNVPNCFITESDGYNITIIQDGFTITNGPYVTQGNSYLPYPSVTFTYSG